MNETLWALKKEFERILATKNDLMLQHKVHDKTDAWHECYYCHPNTSQVSSLAKKVAKLAKVDVQLTDLLLPLLARLQELQAEVAKIKAEKEAAKQAKIERKNNPPATIKSRLHPEVEKLMQQIAKPWHEQAYLTYTDAQKGIVAKFEHDAHLAGSHDPSKVYHVSSRMSRELYRTGIAKQQAVYPYVLTVDMGRVHILRPVDQIAGIIAEKAKRYADELIAAFVHKVGTKLSDLVERKGNLTETSVNGGIADNWMIFKFADGSHFNVQNMIVWVQNAYGTVFNRFPTTFRNVKLASGQMMKTPSEAKMKKEFV